MTRRRSLYPDNWDDLCELVIQRAGNRCEGSPRYPDCRAQNGVAHPATGSKVVLTVAHVYENDTMTQDIDRLAANCQRCHLSRDEALHQRNGSATRRAKEENPYSRNTEYDQWVKWQEEAAYRTSSVYGADICPGWWVAAVLHDPRVCPPVGQVQDVTERGIRITLLDWIAGYASGNDLFIPWASIVTCYVATPEHSLRLFIEEAARVQERYHPSTQPTATGNGSKLNLVPLEAVLSRGPGENE